MLIRPPSQTFQDGYLLLRNTAIPFGAYIQQHIASITNYIGKNSNNLVRGFVVVIVFLITPGIVHGKTQFPKFVLRSGNRHALFGGGVIPLFPKPGI